VHPLAGLQAETNGASEEVWLPETEGERSAVRDQLERVLVSPLFKNSKRYPNLLRFVVERALEGHTDPLKERTLGIEVFGRAPDYDTNLDPVVRTTACEIRKRIAQYYRNPAHEAEIRIELPPGTYLPEFREPQKPADPNPSPELPNKSYAWIGVASVAILLLAGIAFLTAVGTRLSALDRFWAPVLASDDPVSLYIGGYTTGKDVVSVMDLMENERVAFSDATALAKLTSLLAARKKPYRFRLQTSSQIEDLKDGPALLIGAFNNSWALRLTGQLRYRFVPNHQTHINSIQDSQNASAAWAGDVSAPYREMKEDYAIVSRVVDPSTGKIVVTASGLAKFGTEAAGEFLTSSKAMDQIEKSAPRNWDRMNIEIVIGTDVVGRRAGPPRVVATHFW
jgi:hypothetical protein